MNSRDHVRCAAGLLLCLLAWAGDPAGKPENEVPPFRRKLSAEDEQRVKELDAKTFDRWKQGQLEEALELARQVLTIREKAQGADHWETFNARATVTAFETV